jgi:diketogulonate reductase-like aldo/keto reductase
MSFFLFTPPLVNNLRKSLERLGTNSVDLYQVHSAGLYSFKSYADGLAECHKLGLAKAVGVSNLSTAEM